jgi:hypothetical protein
MAEAVMPPGDGSPVPPRSPHASRFAVLLAALAGLAIGAVALAVVLIAAGSDGPDRSWSDWQPSTHELDAAQEIADHVAISYRLASGRQLAIVSGGELGLGGLPAHLAERSTDGDVTIVTGDSVLFTLCGGGPSCSMPTGRPSLERMLLLRREGLELALRAFHDLDGVDNVIALLPPNRELVLAAAAAADRTRMSSAAGRSSASGAGNSSSDASSVPAYALMFRRDQLATSLEQPLETTLPPQTPTPRTIVRAPEAQLVDLVTDPSYYATSIEQGQDANVFLVLSPVG